MAQPYKQCPKCSTVAQVYEPTCAKCGHVFRTQFAPPNQTMFFAGQKRRRWPLIIGAAVVLIIVFSLVSIGYLTRRNTAEYVAFIGRIDAGKLDSISRANADAKLLDQEMRSSQDEHDPRVSMADRAVKVYDPLRSNLEAWINHVELDPAPDSANLLRNKYLFHLRVVKNALDASSSAMLTAKSDPDAAIRKLKELQEKSSEQCIASAEDANNALIELRVRYSIPNEFNIQASK